MMLFGTQCAIVYLRRGDKAMSKFKLGVMHGNYGLPFDEVLEKAARLGLEGIQLSRIRDEFAPGNMPPARLKEVLDQVKSHGLVFSAICGEQLYGFTERERNAQLIENSKRILDMAKELETNIVTTHIGVVPDDTGSETYKVMQEACFELAEYADSLQAHFAIETGPEVSATLKVFLDTLGSRGVAVNLDPANLVMVVGDDPVQAVYNLKDYIVHTHAKDGKRLRKGDVNHLYATAQAEQYHGEYLVERPLGRGDVGFPKYLAALKDIGYSGFLTIEREVEDFRAEDIAYGAGYLRGLINPPAH